mmetsp:Transcript_67011/g.125200  ORF Transcript_67011/g.125200 Transcript_67011/m.125200 type:complete len:644 (-) Transcript_67011:31-1962(-)
MAAPAVDGQAGLDSCAVCGQDAVATCSGCHQIAYCSVSCQRGDWKLHKPVCKAWQEKLTEKTVCKPIETKAAPTVVSKSAPPDSGKPSSKEETDKRAGAAQKAETPTDAPKQADRKSAVADAAAKPTTAPPTIATSPTPAKADGSKQAGGKNGIDYSKFNNIEDSDDERPVMKEEALALPMGLPNKSVDRASYDRVWVTLLQRKDLPFTPPPDLDVMWGFHEHGGLDEQALLDQACEILGKLQRRLPEQEWKGKTYSLTKKLESEGREDEARMWSIITILRLPHDPDGYYNQGVLLVKQSDKAKFGGAPKTLLPSLEKGKGRYVTTEQYCSLFTKAACSYYRRALKEDPKQRAANINLIGTLERNEPQGWYEEVHAVAATAVRGGIWYDVWQRPPHFVPGLLAKPWHVPSEYAIARALEEHYPTIRAEYDAYIGKLESRKDWDDSDLTPGLGDVGNRPGALHDGGLTKSGRWCEVPLVTNTAVQREYADLFPQTLQVLRQSCQDALGLAFCGGGDIIFSVLKPGTRLRPHCGPSNARLTCHLGIHIPRSCDQGSYIRVAAEKPRGWEEGRCIVFDDSFEHEVVYPEAEAGAPYPGDRVVLLANFWHPDFAFKNHPEWREKSDVAMAAVELESLPKTAIMKTDK